MSTAIYRTEDPALETIEFGAVYQIHTPYTGEPWALYRVADDSGVTTIETWNVPDGWDYSYEYAMPDTHTWARIECVAMSAHLADATLELTFAHVNDPLDIYSYAMLYRSTWPH